VPVVSAPDVQVLLTLRLTGLAEVDDLAARTGLADGQVTAEIEGAEPEGLVRYRSGTFHGWALTPAGRLVVHDRLAAELDGHGLRAEVDDLYQRFFGVNRELLEACTAWQLRDVGLDRLVNEHDDPAYDRSCIDRLAGLHAQAEPVVVRLAELFARFERYPRRLGEALRRLEAGEADYFTSPATDSYHTVWFELHEHLLATLGLERADEVTSPREAVR
jgi:hypothetical protein